MYEAFYRLKTKPFGLLPDRSFLYSGSEHQAAYSLLEYGVLSQAPFMVLTGEPGVGKTSLLQKLMAERGNRYTIGLITHTRHDIEHLLPWILLSLGLSTKRLDPIEAYHMFAGFLTQESKSLRRVVLVVDESQNLGAERLEELRLLSNLNDSKILKLQIILSGQPDLYTLLQRIDMTQFAQRIVVDYHLKPLTEVDTARYIRHRLQVAGGHPTLFTNKACALAHRLSHGNPRLINQVSDRALTYGYAEQSRTITSKLIAQAALDRTKGGILPLAAKDELVALAAAAVDTAEMDDPLPSLEGGSNVDESFGPHPPGSSAEAYAHGMALKNQGRFKEAVDMFQLAARGESMWLKSHAQIGHCYRRMREHQAAIQAFRTALNDQSAAPDDMSDILYFLGQSLEFTGQAEEALEVYRRVDQLNPGFKNVTDRVGGLRQSLEQTSIEKGLAMSNSSWLRGTISKWWRSLIGSEK
ncbi:MAG: AAA family ATPase [Nitrospira sp.]|nr:AAA family ATPase [Nitrospira sp.]